MHARYENDGERKSKQFGIQYRIPTVCPEAMWVSRGNFISRSPRNLLAVKNGYTGIYVFAFMASCNKKAQNLEEKQKFIIRNAGCK